MPDTPPMRLAIDVGGTFTDTVLMTTAGEVLATAKTPTTPRAPVEAALAGAQDVLAAAGVGWGAVGGFIHGTTLATNALIEKRGAPVATVTTDGFRDILEIAYERRYSQYAIDIEKPDLLVPRARAFTIGGRIDVQGAERAPLDLAAIPRLAEAIRASGAQAVAVCLLHAYANPDHERRLGAALAEALPGVAISLSHEVSPEAREFDRLCTTIANAYIQPLMAGYLADFAARFRQAGLVPPILMMTAGGGMCTLETAARLPVRLVESGPAGGAILAARIARQIGATRVLSFDMGGTTAKLCLIDAFRPQSARRFEIARAARFVKGSGIPVRIPVLEMIEIGAGGGSIATVDQIGRLSVGPESAGADPGPVAFGRGGARATVTDADVTLGLIEPDRFAEGRLRIDEAAAGAALAADVGTPLGLGPVDAASGVSGVVDEAMAGAGRMHAVESGKELSDRVMIAFGGNGPLHATRVARRAQVRRIVIPRDPGVGSAVGFLHAPVSFEIIRSRAGALAALDPAALNRFLAEMEAEAARVVAAGAPGAEMQRRRVAFMRYRGQGHEIEIPLPDRALVQTDVEALRDAFEAEYARQFSRVVPGMVVEVLNWGVWLATADGAVPRVAEAAGGPPFKAPTTRRIRCDVTGRDVEAAVIDRSDLHPGARIPGPALITEPQTTTFVSADFKATVDTGGNLWLDHQAQSQQTEPDR